MVLIFLIMLSVGLMFGVGILSAIGLGLWKWQGKIGAIGGAILLAAAVVWMVFQIVDTLRGAQSNDINVRAVANMSAWSIGVPCALAVIAALWMLRLASR